MTRTTSNGMERKVKANGFNHPDYQKGPTLPRLSAADYLPSGSWWAIPHASREAFTAMRNAEQARMAQSRFGQAVALNYADVEPARHKKQDREL